MARSYRKTPIIKDNLGGRKFAKRKANKRVRRFKGDISDGKQYRKLYSSYDIYDYVSYYPYELFKKLYKDKDSKRCNWKTEEDCYRAWAKIFLYK